MSEDLVIAIADLEEKRALAIAQQMLDGGADPNAVIDQGRAGMEKVGQRFENCEYFLADLMMAAAIFKQITAIVEPQLKKQGSSNLGKVVIGTVKGDIHDIGKNIVATMLRAASFEVVDLGVDVTPERFIAVLKETGATVLGLSALLTISFDSIKDTVAAVQQAGLKDKVKIMIGGGPVDERVRAYSGADAVGKDAMEAISLCRGLAGVK